MKLIKITAHLSLLTSGSKLEEELDVYVEDDATEEQIHAAKEEAAKEWMFDQIDWGWE